MSDKAKVFAAIAAAQAEFPPITMDAEVEVSTKSGHKYKFRYATLGHIMTTIKPVLSKHGLAVSQPLAGKNLETLVIHSSGECHGASVELPITSNMNTQDIGGVITYLRRYSVSAILGLVTDQDDDANGASGNDAKPTAPRQEPPKAAPVAPAKPTPPPAKEAPKAQPRQATREMPNGTSESEVVFGKVREKSGTSKKGQPYTIYSAKAGDHWYGTFDAKYGFFMAVSNAEDAPVTVMWKPGFKEGNRDITDMAVPPEFQKAWERHVEEQMNAPAPKLADEVGGKDDPF